MEFIYDDGGRNRSGFRGRAGDCVTRSIAIATGLPYCQVYDDLNKLAKNERTGKRKHKKSSSRTGIYKQTYSKYLESIGWKWRPTMGIGTGCKVHLVENELPTGRLIVRISKHMTAIINHVIHDISDPQRKTHWVGANGKIVRTSDRCVYGYWYKPQS